METTVRKMALTEIKNNWSAVVTRAKEGMPTIGTDRGKDAVAVVSVDVLMKFIEGERSELHEMIRARRDEPTTDLADELEAVVNQQLGSTQE
jgi:antitoxin (DNA-binding transcriptional repressor) of toxin-antitoxin stability system